MAFCSWYHAGRIRYGSKNGHSSDGWIAGLEAKVAVTHETATGQTGDAQEGRSAGSMWKASLEADNRPYSTVHSY